MYRFTFDHSSSDGSGGYGAVCVDLPDSTRAYVGRGFAPTVLVERWPTGLTYDEAAQLVTWLAEGVSFARVAHAGSGEVVYSDGLAS